MMALFDYEKPELLDFNSDVVHGVSCYVDCNTDDICPGGSDEIKVL